MTLNFWVVFIYVVVFIFEVIFIVRVFLQRARSLMRAIRCLKARAYNIWRCCQIIVTTLTDTKKHRNKVILTLWPQPSLLFSNDMFTNIYCLTERLKQEQQQQSMQNILQQITCLGTLKIYFFVLWEGVINIAGGGCTNLAPPFLADPI